jgi:hypothetical protein
MGQLVNKVPQESKVPLDILVNKELKVQLDQLVSEA